MNEGEKTIWEEIEYLLFEGFQAVVDFRGPLKVNEFIFFHKESRSLILTDTAFNFDENFPLRTRLASQAIGSYKKLRPSFLEKIATQEKERVKNSVQKILNWDFKRVIMAHGSIVENDAKRKFKEGYEWFLGTSF